MIPYVRKKGASYILELRKKVPKNMAWLNHFMGLSIEKILGVTERPPKYEARSI